MGEAACRVARAAGYVNAGTVEFLARRRPELLLPRDEHAAAGRAPGHRDGHRHRPRARAAARRGRRAARLRAGRRHLAGLRPSSAGSTPRIRSRGWMPSPGTITGLRPAAGPWVRDDSGAYEGYTVPRCYDTLLAKLIVWGADRPAAIERMIARAGRVHGGRACAPRSRPCSASSRTRTSAPGGSRPRFLERVLPDLRGPRTRATLRSPSSPPCSPSTSAPATPTVRVEPSVDDGPSAGGRAAASAGGGPASREIRRDHRRDQRRSWRSPAATAATASRSVSEVWEVDAPAHRAGHLLAADRRCVATWPTWSIATAPAWWTWAARPTRSSSRSRRAGSSARTAGPAAAGRGQTLVAPLPGKITHVAVRPGDAGPGRRHPARHRGHEDGERVQGRQQRAPWSRCACSRARP